MSLRALLAPLISGCAALGCSLEYLDARLDAAGDAGPGAASSSSSGSAGCGCGTLTEGVLYDENFDAPGFCNPDLGTTLEVGATASVDPDFAPEEAACGSLRLSCSDAEVECHGFALDTVEPAITQPFYLRARIRINGPPTSSTGWGDVWVLEVGQASQPGSNYSAAILVRMAESNMSVLACGWSNCGPARYVAPSDDDWHTVVLYVPLDAETELLTQWDGTETQHIPPNSLLTDPSWARHVNFGWANLTFVQPLDAPDVALDDVRICTQEAAAACDWQPDADM